MMNSRLQDQDHVWRPYLIALVLSLLWIIGWYHETALAMVRIWARSETFTHAFLIPPISLWLIWEQRKQLLRLTPQPNIWLALLLVAIGFAWLLGELASVNAVTQFAFTAMLVLTVPLLVGVRAALTIAFPLAFLFLAVPFGEFVMPRLMEWTADVTVLGLQLSGIPVHQEGLRFIIPSGSWSVIEACSGVRYLIASFTVGVLFAYLNYRSLKRRLIFIIASILVPVIANWGRAYMIVMLGHLSGNKIATGVDHIIYGWLFFGLVITIMFIVGMRWREDLTDTGSQESVPPIAQPSARGVLVGAFLALLILTLAPHAVLWALDRHDEAAPPRLALEQLGTVAGWHSETERFANWTPAFSNPSAEVHLAFSDGPRKVGLYLGYYRNQSYDRKLVSSDNVLVKSDDPFWIQLETASRSIVVNGLSLPVHTTLLGNIAGSAGSADGRLAVWQWYWINGRLTASDYRAKAYIAISRLLGQGDDAAVIIVYAPTGQTPDTQALLDSFIQSAGHNIEMALQATRDQR